MRQFVLLIVVFFTNALIAQSISANRTTDWTLAGLRDTSTFGFEEIDMIQRGAIGDGILYNDSILNAVISKSTFPGLILNFGKGDFLFGKTIKLPSNTVIRGLGPSKTKFTMDFGGKGDGIVVTGSSSTVKSFLEESAIHNSKLLKIKSANLFKPGDWIRLIQNDSDLITSSWARTYVGQIIKIKRIVGNELELESPLRKNFDLFRKPFVQKILLASNVGIECMSIVRKDNTAPEQASNIVFNYAANCWVSGIESANCTFAHIELERSTNVFIEKSYMHHAHGYGGGGRAYGVMVHLSSGENRIENNIFEHLRHSIIVQAGANGNVFSYNYSNDPFWDSGNPLTPSNSSGDMVLHGNFVYMNLFEQNVCQNIVIDNSHGPNGPYNTFFRNRAQGFGIFFSAANSPKQNFVANEITNNSFPYNLVNYTILGDSHFLYGNYDKGKLVPSGSTVLERKTYAYKAKPNFIASKHWASIGIPNAPGSNTISSYDRVEQKEIFAGSCGEKHLSIAQTLKNEANIVVDLVNAEIRISAINTIDEAIIYNLNGKVLLKELSKDKSLILTTNGIRNLVVVLKLSLNNGDIFSRTLFL